MQTVIEEALRVAGWTVLKVLTLGEYRSDGERARLVEGALGLLVAGILCWIGIRLA
jgi:hypothetical protein